jgi:hypothetical protein
MRYGRGSVCIVGAGVWRLALVWLDWTGLDWTGRMTEMVGRYLSAGWTAVQATGGAAFRRRQRALSL